MPTPTDALTIEATLYAAGDAFAFDCLEFVYDAKMHGLYTFRALLVSDVNEYALQGNGSAIQLDRQVEIRINSERFDPLFFAGVIRRIEGSSKFANQKEGVWIESVPECYALSINRRSGIYLEASVRDVIERGIAKRFQALGYQNIVVSQNLSADAAAYPSQKSMTQYGESDLAFIFRSLAEYGIWTSFRQDFVNQDKLKLVIANHNTALNDAGEVDLLVGVNQEGAGVYHADFSVNQNANAVRAIYFDESQNRYVMHTSALPTVGASLHFNLDHHCLANCLTDPQVASTAEIVKDSLRMRQRSLRAQFQGLALQPADVIKLMMDGVLTPFVITAIHYEFAKGDNTESASTQFSQNHRLVAEALVDVEGEPVPYRAPIWLYDEKQGFYREYPNYHYRGILSGCYGMPAGEVVVPDQSGNIPLQFPYNYTEACGKTPARYTRVMSLSNQGGMTGRSFPVYKDTELQVMFANGNMDYPLIKGAAANAATGHVHNSTVQSRTYYALPQGQYHSYSNVPGDHNFVTMGAEHTEGQSRSFMMLSNQQDQNNPGSKKLDQQFATHQSYEEVSLGDYHSRQAGNSNTTGKAQKFLPMTYIRFVIGDQTNIQNPSSPPMLDDYLQGIGAECEFTHQSGRINKLAGLSAKLTGKVYAVTQILSRSIDSSVPIDISEIKITLFHSGKNGTDKSIAVTIIAHNSKPVFPVNTMSLAAKDWQQNKQVDGYGNMTYIVNLNLLAPALLFNFRQDYWQKELKGDDLLQYQALKPYFQNETYSGVVRATPFTQHELDFFESMGNNVTLFIHGYNIGFGAWPSGLQAEKMVLNGQDVFILTPGGYGTTLCRDDVYCKTAYPEVMPDILASLPRNPRYGSEAHKWLLCMEHSLNQAAGFDGKDYSHYTRLIGVAWQGNPTHGPDYSAANPMAAFPAGKVYELVQQLHERGIKINIMAHSLGNAVLMHVLDLCGANGIEIDHAFLWDAAIPNTAFDDNSKKAYLPLILPDSVTGQVCAFPYFFNFPNAVKGVKQVSVLYSMEDTVLGAIPKGDEAWSVLQQTMSDPAAGVTLAGVTAGTIGVSDALDMLGLKRALNSIYYVASLFTYPLSFFTSGTREALEGYYQAWRTAYPQAKWQSPQGSSYSPSRTLETQRSQMAFYYPALFNLLTTVFELTDQDTHSIDANYNNLTDKEKATAAIVHALHLMPFLPAAAMSAIVATGSASSAAEEHAKDVASIILTALLCSNVQPDAALGYQGITTDVPSYHLVKNGLIIQSGQTKPGTQPGDEDHYLCVDHDAMLFPTPDFMKYVYKGILFEAQTNIKFQYFGKWKPA